MMARGWMVWGLGAALLACDGQGSALPYAEAGPLALENALLYVGHLEPDDGPKALLVDLSSRVPALTSAALGEGATQLAERPAQAAPEALVLTAGRAAYLEDDEPRDAVPARLTALTRDGVRATYALPGRLDHLQVSDEGRYALAFGPGDTFQLELSLSIVDLTRAPNEAGAVATLSLRTTTGQVPDGFVFSPADVAHPTAVAPLENLLLVLDLANPGLPPISVPLALPSDDSPVTARKLLFTRDRILARGGDGRVFVVEFSDDPSSARGFRATTSQLDLGTGLVDLAIEPDSGSLLALHDEALSAYDAESLQTFAVTFAGDFRHVLTFRDRARLDAEVRPRALLFGPAETRLGFVDLNFGAPAATQEVEFIDLFDPVESVELVPARSLAIATHGSGRISLVDLVERTVAPIGTGDHAQRTQLDAARGRLWIATEAGRVGSFDLDTLAGSELLFATPTIDLAFVPGATPRIALVHAADGGHVTLVDAAHPSRDAARELAGFLWSGLFD